MWPHLPGRVLPLGGGLLSAVRLLQREQQPSDLHRRQRYDTHHLREPLSIGVLTRECHVHPWLRPVRRDQQQHHLPEDLGHRTDTRVVKLTQFG